MVSATDYHKVNGHAIDHDTPERGKRPRFRLLSALAAPFQDLDERAIRRKKNTRHKIIGAPFSDITPGTRGPIPTKGSSRGAD
jgi:hypothetical protein